jgi:hypothetical protein
MMLEIKGLQAKVGETPILKGLIALTLARRGARHHGAQRLRQEHAGSGVLAGREATRSRAAR